MHVEERRKTQIERRFQLKKMIVLYSTSIGSDKTSSIIIIQNTLWKLHIRPLLKNASLVKSSTFFEIQSCYRLGLRRYQPLCSACTFSFGRRECSNLWRTLRANSLTTTCLFPPHFHDVRIAPALRHANTVAGSCHHNNTTWNAWLSKRFLPCSIPLEPKCITNCSASYHRSRLDLAAEDFLKKKS